MGRRRSAFAVPFAALAVCGVVAACAGSGHGNGSSSSGGSSSGGGGGSSGGGSEGDASLVGDGSAAEALSGEAGCATASARADRAPVYILFVLDGSISMAQESKWPAASGALEDLVGGMSDDPSIGVGLIVYGDSMDPTAQQGLGGGPYPESIDVPIGEVTIPASAAIVDRLAGVPSGNTPTYYALQGAYGELASFAPVAPLEPGGKGVLVLLTDGVPTYTHCSTAQAGATYPTNPCVLMAAAQATSTAPSGAVVTFVIGTGQFPSSNTQDFDPAWLGYLALAGGGAPAGCNPAETQNAANLCYFEVDPTLFTSAAALQAQFATALQAIRHQVLGCTFPLSSTGLGTVDPTKVNVQVDGQVVLQSPTDGWTYDDPAHPTEIVFNGPACDALKNDPNAVVSVVVGCETQVAN
ncbi:MAG: vWA domain-containing protein [Polyangiaceae bacterium]